MDPYRENIVRGTPDFPFARYFLTSKQASASFRHIHWHPEMEILYMQQGIGEVRAGKHEFLLHSGEFAIIHPNELHGIRPLGANCKHSAFVFSLDLITFHEYHFFQTSLIHPLRTGAIRFPQHIRQDDPLHAKIHPPLSAICRCDEAADNYKYTVFLALLEVFSTLSAHAATSDEREDPHNETVIHCIRYMQANYQTPLRLSQIALQVHLHPNYLCKLFRNYTGQTVFEYLNRLRIERAAQLLCTSDDTITRVACECGFESVSFFSRKFKSIIGTSPKQYRLHHADN